MTVKQPVNADFIKNIGDLSKHIDDVVNYLVIHYQAWLTGLRLAS